MKLFLVSLFFGVAAAFTAPSSVSRPTTRLNENFGLGIGEDTYQNQVDQLGGEANYKQWVNKVQDNSFLNRKYNVVGRVRELDLLGKTANEGVLSKLEAQGLDLVTIEKLLPFLEQLGAAEIAGNNQQLLLNGLAPLLVEGAPFLLPVVAGALGVGPPAFYLAAAGTGALEIFLVANNVEIPFVGLSAGVFLGLILVPLTAVFAIVGNTLGSLKK